MPVLTGLTERTGTPMCIVQLRMTVNLYRRTILTPSWHEHRLLSSDSSLPLPSALERIKKPTRGGQNLTERYRRLANSVREKDRLSAYIQEQTTVDAVSNTKPAPSSFRSEPITFRGFTIPTEPKEPASDGISYHFIHLILTTNQLLRMLYVGMCDMRV